MCGERWAMPSDNPAFSSNLRAAFAAAGHTVLEASKAVSVPKRTIDSWLSPSNPRIPRADECARLAAYLGTTVEKLSNIDVPQQVASPAFAFGDIIQDLNILPDYRLEDVRRLIAPWANEARGASQQIIDIVADLKVLPGDRLEDLRRLVRPWAEEARGEVERGTEKAG